MNVCGLKLNLKLIKKFTNYNIYQLKKEDIRGISEFEEYNWDELDFEEFKTLIKAMNVLIASGSFSKFNDLQEFVFFYKTDVTELDIVTVLKYRKRSVLIDIEVKSTIQSSQKLTAQINKRIKNHFPQLIPNMEYVIIGITDTQFVRAKTNLKSHNKKITSLGNLKNILDEFNYSQDVRNYLIQANNLVSINTIFKSIENSTFTYYEETNQLFNYATRNLGNTTDVILCLSKAGTGKSIAALKMFFEMENSLLLMMNIKFYNTLNLNKYYSENRCTWSPDVFKTYDLDNNVCIVDECQRLSIEQILDLASKCRKLILFGDLDQSFMENDLLTSKSILVSTISSLGKKVKLKPLVNAKRFSNSASICIDFLLDYKEKEITEKLSGYNINIFYDEEMFIKKYNDCQGIKKMYMTYNHKNNFITRIGSKRFTHANWNHDNFSIDIANSDLIGNTLHAISFDVEHCFVYLPDIFIKEEGDKVYFVYEGIENDNIKIRKLHNELVILFSRGQLSLNVCVVDLKTYLLFNKRFKKISNK